MFSDTLFGHPKGAYTGADRMRDGLITQAAEGTLFLDEIGDLVAASQVTLLRLLQDSPYYPLGADRPRQSRARVIVATNYDVAERVHEGLFRKDLYYRLRTHHIQLPPLRARREDLPLLINHFLEKAAQVLHKPTPTPPLALYRLFQTYAFPGNVRELEAMVFDAVTRYQGGLLSLQSFKAAIAEGPPLSEEWISRPKRSPMHAMKPWSNGGRTSSSSAPPALGSRVLSGDAARLPNVAGDHRPDHGRIRPSAGPLSNLPAW